MKVLLAALRAVVNSPAVQREFVLLVRLAAVTAAASLGFHFS